MDPEHKKGTSVLAVLSGLLGLASFGLLFFTGVPAMILGLYGLREVNASDGALRGRWAAIVGMAAGAVGALAGVIGIIALIIIGVRGNAQRLQCQDHLRRIGGALWLYQEEQRHFPMGTLPSADLPPERRLSWYLAMLPVLEVQPGQAPHPRQKQWDQLAARVDRAAAWDAAGNLDAAHTPVRWFACPARSLEQPIFDTNYAGIAGVGAGAAELPIDSPQAGVFGYTRETRPADITRGLAQTMMGTETAWRTGAWLAGGFPTVRGIEPDDHGLIGPGRPWGGLHQGGLNVLFADGSVQFLSESIEPDVFESLARMHAPEEAR